MANQLQQKTAIGFEYFLRQRASRRPMAFSFIDKISRQVISAGAVAQKDIFHTPGTKFFQMITNPQNPTM